MKYQEIPANTSGIYQINFPNGKIYVGRAKNIKVRIWEHYTKNDNTPCQVALRKYYKSFYDIDVEILEEINPYDYKIICELEIKWIEKTNSMNKKIGYNLVPGGEGGGDGINNPASKFTEEDLSNIVSLLKQQKTNIYIAKIYNVHPDTIGHINTGKRYYNSNIQYPIRKNKGIIEYQDMYNSFTVEQLELALYLLSTTKIPYSEITKQTSISKSTLTALNVGRHPYCSSVNLNFPIRKTRRTIRLTEKEIEQIKKELLNKDLSIEDIAKHFNCSRDTISDINQGKKYSNINETYPIRNFYPNRGSKKSVSTISGSGE